MLHHDEQVKFVLFGIDLVCIGILGDGSCFLHCILKALYGQEYLNYSVEQRLVFAKQIRQILGNNLTIDVYTKLGNGNIASLYDYTTFKNHLMSSNWIGDESIEYISNTFDVDILIVTSDGLYNIGYNDLLIKCRPTIIVNYVENKHYELIGMEKDGNIQIKFKSDDVIVKRLKKEIQK